MWVSPLSLQLWQVDTRQYLIIRRSPSTNCPLQAKQEATFVQKEITVCLKSVVSQATEQGRIIMIMITIFLGKNRAISIPAHVKWQ